MRILLKKLQKFKFNFIFIFDNLFKKNYKIKNKK